MLLFNRRRLLKIACAGLAAIYFPVHAQTYPARSIGLIVPFPPGAKVD